MLEEVATDNDELLEGEEVETRSITTFRPLKPARQLSTSTRVRNLARSRFASRSFRSSKNFGSTEAIDSQRRTKPDDPSRTTILAPKNSADAWLAYRVVGGLRADPFDSFPVEPRDCVPSAVDHFIQIFIPERILRPFSAVPGIQNLARDYFQLSINDVGLFEATIAQSQASFVAQRAIRRPTKEVLHHHGQALAHLQKKLASPEECTADATIHSILAIMGTHFFFGELDAHQAHLDGLWALIRRRGGIDTLGWNGTLKQAVETVTSFRSYAAKVDTPAATPEAVGPDLDYPNHPFSADLCEAIAKLPEGFGELALRRQLSIQTINLLGDINSRLTAQRDVPDTPSSGGTPKQHIYEADKCVELLKSSGMPDFERMVCAGLLAYTVQSQSYPQGGSQTSSQNPSPFLSQPVSRHSSHTPELLLSSSPASSSSSPRTNRTSVYDETLKALVSGLAHYTYFKYEDDALVWITYAFAAMQSHLMRDRRDFFHHTLLRFKQSTTWTGLEAVLRKFFWTERRIAEWKDAWDEARRVHRPPPTTREEEEEVKIGLGLGLTEKRSGEHVSWKEGRTFRSRRSSGDDDDDLISQSERAAKQTDSANSSDHFEVYSTESISNHRPIPF